MHKILKGKEILKVNDIAEAFGCSKAVAYRIIQDIKADTDRLRLKGKVHISDYCKHFGLNAADYK